MQADARKHFMQLTRPALASENLRYTLIVAAVNLSDFIYTKYRRVPQGITNEAVSDLCLKT